MSRSGSTAFGKDAAKAILTWIFSTKGAAVTNSAAQVQKGDLTEWTVTIVAAFVSNNTVSRADLPGLIGEVHKVVQEMEGSPEASKPLLWAPRGAPAVPIAKSITSEAIYCLEDGRPLKSLKRYLRARFNLTPEQYRERWGLPEDYPMVAPGYSAVRSRLAKSMGLGRKDRGGIGAG